MRLENILYICFTSILLTSVGIAYNVFYIRELFSDRIQSPILGWMLGLTFNLFWLLTAFTYLKTAFSSPGCIVFSEKLLKHLQEEEQSNVAISSSINKERVESELIEGVSKTQSKKQCKELLLQKDEENQQTTQKYSYSVKGLEDIQMKGSMRCRVCGNFKLIRMHHCRSCDKCIFRRDHHCPWIGNCVGIGNHKFFIQFLGYAAITLLLIAFPILIDFTGNGLGVANSKKEFIPYVILGTLLIMSCAFSISICILFSFHIYLACNNQTTLELNNSVSSNIQRAFDRGSKYFNLVEIFGEKFSYRWFLPLTASFGETYKIKCDSYELNLT